MSSEYPVDGTPEEMPLNDSPEAAIEALQKLIVELQAEKAELQDKYLRAVADSQNIRRRGQQDIEKERKFGIERFARDLLSVADNLGRALTAVPADLDPAMKNVVVGVQATERELLSVLERHGVTRVSRSERHPAPRPAAPHRRDRHRGPPRGLRADDPRLGAARSAQRPGPRDPAQGQGAGASPAGRP